MPTQPHALTTLSFAGSTGKGSAVNLWEQFSSEDATKSNAEGRRRAGELAYFMEQHDLPFLFGHVMACIVKAGQWGPLEIGFCQRIAELALAAEIPVVVIPGSQITGRPQLELIQGGVS